MYVSPRWQASNEYAMGMAQKKCMGFISKPWITLNILFILHSRQTVTVIKIIVVCSGTHTKNINTMCGHDVEFLNVKPGGKYSNNWALKL